MTDEAQTDPMQHAMAVQEKYRAMLMLMPGVVGLGVGLVHSSDTGTDEIGVIVLTDASAISSQTDPRKLIPKRIDGVPFDVQPAGPFTAFG
jgi:hypothetical protein